MYRWQLASGMVDMVRLSCNVPQRNFDSVRDALSRGALPTAFLNGSKSPDNFCADLDLQANTQALVLPHERLGACASSLQYN